MESNKREIAKFYEQVFSDTKLKEKLEEKAKAIVNEEDLKNLIQQEIVPLMKKYNVNFSEKELLEYEEETLKKLSKEDLDDVSGGVSIKPMLGTGLLALTLMGVAATGQTSNAMFNGDDDDNGGKPQSSFFGGLLGAVKSLLPGSQQSNSDLERFNAAINEHSNTPIDATHERFKQVVQSYFNVPITALSPDKKIYILKHVIDSEEYGIDSDGNIWGFDKMEGSDKVNIYLYNKKGQVEAQVPEKITTWSGVEYTVGEITGVDRVKKLTISPDVKNIKIGGLCGRQIKESNGDISRTISNLEILDFSNYRGEKITIADDAFFACDLKEIRINSENIEWTDNIMFFGGEERKQLESVELKGKTIKIGNNAFNSLEDLKEVHINGENVELGKRVFGECKNLETIKLEGKTINVGEYAFDCENLQKIHINCESVDLGEYAFENCKNLQEADINSKTISIKRGAFNGCNKLKTIRLDGKTINVGNWAFDCKNLQEAHINGENVELGERAFEYCKNLKTINIDGKTINVGKSAFENCENLQEAHINGESVDLGERAFEYCKNLKTTNIDGKTINVGESAFENCENLQEADINSKTISIKRLAFNGCDNLEKVNFSEDCEHVKIEGNAFSSEKLNLLEILAEDVTCAEDIGAVWYDKDGNRHPELSHSDNNVDANKKVFRASVEKKLSSLEKEGKIDPSDAYRQAKSSNCIAIFGDQIFIIKHTDDPEKVKLIDLVCLSSTREYNYPSNGILQDGSMVKSEGDNYLNFIKDNNQIETINFGPGIKEVSFENDLFKGNKSLTTVDFRTATDLENVTFSSSSCEGSNLTNVLLPKQGVNFNADPNAFGGTPIATFAATSKMFFFREPIQDQAKRVLKCLNSCTDFEYLLKYILSENSIKNLATVLNNVKSAIKLNPVTGEREFPGINLTSSECQKIINAAEAIDDYVE